MDPAQFPFLLKLLDDDSTVVQEEIRRALVSLASQLPQLYAKHQVAPEQRLQVHRALWNWRKGQLLTNWNQWRLEEDRYQALEGAHQTLGAFASGLLETVSLAERLDALAKEHADVQDAGELAVALFSEKLRGDSDTYYSPDNSYLTRVLKRAQGNPISLCNILILIGHRLGFAVWGCNYPGHFLAICDDRPQLWLLDCFHGGRSLGPELSPELKGSLLTAQVDVLCRSEVGVEEIVERVVRNLEGAYRSQERRPQANLFYLLLKDTVARNKGLGQGQSLREPLFQPGQLVTHREKGYRGVILDYELYLVDSELAGHEPLYRILPHGKPQVDTARESRLIDDKSGRLVAHPLMSLFFDKFADGVYYRNSKPWEKT